MLGWRTGVVIVCLSAARSAPGQEKLHFTYLWHMEQPIYWPDQQAGGADRTERAWQSIQRTDGGAQHPANNLREIFSNADRVAAYQWRVKDSINAIRWANEAGAQVSFSGGLVENLTSLGAANQLGYGSGWYNEYRTARSWSTVGQSKPRLDVVLFAFHHPLLPLCDETTVRRSVALYRQAYAGTWGASPAMSRGFFPSEMAFSTRLISALAAEGVTWVFVSAEKISRACENFPVVFGSGGVNCDPPNRADQVNPAQAHFFRQSISRGCGPAEAYPFALTPHRARYVDPATGAASSIIVVPCSQSLSWQDGYSAIGLGGFNTLEQQNNPARPMLVVLAHDGDNNWGGGYSYYLEATPNLVSQAQNAGYTATTVEEYLADHPVPANDYVHVEDGAWVNADGDFGAPQFLNWNWPPVNAQGDVDIAGGWAEDIRNWAVITAAQNRVETAEQVAGQSLNYARILNPDSSTTGAERAWHFFLASLNSGYMYYGTSLDMEVKPTVACNEAVQHADGVIGSGVNDATAPTVWLPQRWPWNPGDVNFGPAHGYRQVVNNGDFRVWTFAYDVSGVSSVNLKYRVDIDGINAIASDQNETYAGGAEVGAWQTVAMARRAFPAGNFFNSGSIDFFEMPQYIAEQFHVQVTGIRGKLLDYYVEATDGRGFVKRSPIQHVWVGDGAGGGDGEVVTADPDPAEAGENVTISYNPAGRALAGSGQVFIHRGINGWQEVGTDQAMTWNVAVQRWQTTFSVPGHANVIDVAFNNGSGTWDNNGGQDWHIPVTGGQQDWVMDGLRDASSRLVASRAGMSLWAEVRGDQLYVACPDAGEGNDHFIALARAPGALRSAMWAKTGQVADWDAFLADENNNDFEGWFDAAGTRRAATGANGGVLEGTINLREEMGTLPPSVFLAVLPYGTNDGGSLVAGAQVPAGNGNGNVEAGEYVEIELCELKGGGCCAADFDGDGFVTGVDFDLFVGAFEAGDASADFDGDGFISGVDFDLYVGAYQAGC